MADERPNILFIMTDQQRGDCLGLDGHPVLNTPNLDYLAHSGTLFRHGYSETPSCIPARRTVMSGQAPATHGMVGMTGGVDWQPAATLAGELSAAGYQCEMIGKLHLWPHRKRFGFHHMLVADSTRGKVNDYLDWLGGAVPIERWAMAHGISPNGWQARPTTCRKNRRTPSGASPRPSSSCPSATPRCPTSSTCRSLTRIRPSPRRRSTTTVTPAATSASRPSAIGRRSSPSRRRASIPRAGCPDASSYASTTTPCTTAVPATSVSSTTWTRRSVAC